MEKSLIWCVLSAVPLAVGHLDVTVRWCILEKVFILVELCCGCFVQALIGNENGCAYFLVICSSGTCNVTSAFAGLYFLVLVTYKWSASRVMCLDAILIGKLRHNGMAVYTFWTHSDRVIRIGQGLRCAIQSLCTGLVGAVNETLP